MIARSPSRPNRPEGRALISAFADISAFEFWPSPVNRYPADVYASGGPPAILFPRTTNKIECSFNSRAGIELDDGFLRINTERAFERRRGGRRLNGPNIRRRQWKRARATRFVSKSGRRIQRTEQLREQPPSPHHRHHPGARLVRDARRIDRISQQAMA